MENPKACSQEFGWLKITFTFVRSLAAPTPPHMVSIKHIRTRRRVHNWVGHELSMDPKIKWWSEGDTHIMNWIHYEEQSSVRIVRVLMDVVWVLVRALSVHGDDNVPINCIGLLRLGTFRECRSLNMAIKIEIRQTNICRRSEETIRNSDFILKRNSLSFKELMSTWDPHMDKE